MAEVKWIKVATDIFEDEKIVLIETLPEGDSIITIWFKLLCFAGKQNNSGVFLLGKRPYTVAMLAAIFRRPVEVVQNAIEVLLDFGLLAIEKECIIIPNWGKHQSLDQVEKKNEYMKNYMAEYRKRQRELTEDTEEVNGVKNVKPNVNLNSKANSKTNVSPLELDNKNKNKELDNNILCSPEAASDSNKAYQNESFNRFWKAYPRKIGKQKCINWWKQHKPDATLTDKMIQTIDAFKASVWEGKEVQYIPHPYTWLNRGGWDDEVPESNTYYEDPNAGFTIL